LATVYFSFNVALTNRNSFLTIAYADKVYRLIYFVKVIASDKQVKLTRAFLEEQAVERESERDESTKKINEMVQLLKLRDRQLASKTQLEQDVRSKVIIYCLLVK